VLSRASDASAPGKKQAAAANPQLLANSRREMKIDFLRFNTGSGLIVSMKNKSGGRAFPQRRRVGRS
jgi:hypothetical protein